MLQAGLTVFDGQWTIKRTNFSDLMCGVVRVGSTLNDRDGIYFNSLTHAAPEQLVVSQGVADALTSRMDPVTEGTVV